MSNTTPWWEENESEQWKGESPENKGKLEQEKAAPQAGEKEQPPYEEIKPLVMRRSKADRYRLIGECALPALLTYWAMLNTFDLGPSFFRFYPLGGTEFLLRCIFSWIVAFIGSHNRWTPLIWWLFAFFFPPVTLVYLLYYNHLNKTKQMWRWNDILFVILCAVYFYTSYQVARFGNRMTVYALCALAAAAAAAVEYNITRKREHAMGRVQDTLSALPRVFPDTSAALHLLTLGKGMEELAGQFIKTYPNASAVVFEHPDSAAGAQPASGHHSDEKDIRAQQGDFNRDPLGGPYDIVIASEILSLISGGTDRFAERVAQSIRTHGFLLLIDWKTSGSEKKRGRSLCPGFQMSMRTASISPLLTIPTARWQAPPCSLPTVCP